MFKYRSLRICIYQITASRFPKRLFNLISRVSVGTRIETSPEQPRFMNEAKSRYNYCERTTCRSDVQKAFKV